MGFGLLVRQNKQYEDIALCTKKYFIYIYALINAASKITIVSDAFDAHCCHFRYVEEHIQKAGVAIETQGFTFVTSGRKRESLTVRTSTFPALIHKDLVFSVYKSP